MTKEEVYEKVKKLIEKDELVLSRGKVLIPIPDGLLTKDEIVRLYITYNVEIGLITSEKANGIRGSLSSKTANLDTILNETLSSSMSGYCRLSHIDQVLKKDGKHTFRFTLANVFEYHMTKGYVEYSPEMFQVKISEFFKYLPQLSIIHRSYDKGYFNGGYCCEEHDGPIDGHYAYKYKDAVAGIKFKLSKITEK